MLEEKEWYDQAELAEEWNINVARVRQTTATLDSIGAIETRDKPGDRRVKQISKNSVEKVRIATLGS